MNAVPPKHSRPFERTIATATIAGLLLSACSIRKVAINKLGDALARGGTAFASDDDPELVRDAVPFSLKLIESLLAESPRHRGLLTAAASGFTQYAYAFIQQDADEADDRDIAAGTALRARARRMYLRARSYGLRGLELDHPGFERVLRDDPARAVTAVVRREVPLLYWTAASWGSAIAISKDKPELVAEQPLVEALIDRALALDERWDSGAIHSFLISYESARQGAEGEAADRAHRHFERAMALSSGGQASPLVAVAEAVALAGQDRKGFVSYLTRALAVDPDARPQWRLANLVAQRRARWLMAKVDDLIPEPGR